MSGSIFFLCAGPLIRAQMAHLVVHRGRSNLFVDDVAIALLQLDAAFLGIIMKAFASWKCATGLARASRSLRQTTRRLR